MINGVRRLFPALQLQNVSLRVNGINKGRLASIRIFRVDNIADCCSATRENGGERLLHVVHGEGDMRTAGGFTAPGLLGITVS